MALTQIDDRGLKTPIDLLDDEQIRLGTGNDLKIYHNGTDNYIMPSNGKLIINNGSETLAQFISDGACELYHNGVKKLNTDSGGIEVVGAVMPTGNISMVDSAYLKIGTGDDLKLYHDGDHSYIDHGGTGHLYIYGNGSGDIVIRPDENKESIKCNSDSSVEIYYNNLKQVETTNDGITVTNSNTNVTGAQVLLKNYNNTVGYLYGSGTSTPDFGLLDSQGHWGVKVIKDGAVELYHDNSKKLETTSGGAKVTGALEVGGAVNLTDTSTGTGTNGGMYRHSNGWTYYQGKSDGNGAVLSNGDGTATVKAVSPGGSNGYISIESGDGTERARITSGGHVLIGDEGNDNAFFKAHAADGEANNLYVGQFINAEATAGSNYGVNIQGGSNSSDHGLRVKNHAGTAQLLVRGDGEVQIGSGDLVFGTAGKGVVLGSTSNTDANTLSDYEEGTFNLSPNLTNVSYDQQEFKYVKIGSVVHWHGRLHYDSASGTSDQILGLPFAPNQYFMTSSVYVDSGLTLSDDYFCVYTGTPQARLHMAEMAPASGINMPSAADIYMTGFYFTDS